MNISVIIPIYNANTYLPDLFKSLDENSFNEDDEILLIDNGSTDDSLKLCKEQEQRCPNLYRVLSFTEKAGSYAARNYGVRNAKGDLLVFTDGDTKPVPSWIDVIRNSARKDVVLAGKIQLEVVNKCLWELYDNLTHLNSEKNAQNSNVATANMAVHKIDFERVGFFEERFSGGDYDWSRRAKEAGLEIKFNKDALVYHPTRKTFDQILKKEQRIAYGVGNHYKLNDKWFVFLVMKYFVKIFKIDTNIKLHNALKRQGVSKDELKEFDKSFWKIRIEQFKYAIQGYKMVDVRKTGVK